MDFLNMPDWLKLEMVQSVGVKILHVAVWLVFSWILLKLFCQVLRKITVLKMSPQASRLTVKIVKNAGYIIIGVEAFALMGFDKSLIVCPVALRDVWVDEVATHRPDKTIHVMASTNWDGLMISAKQRAKKWGDRMAAAEPESAEWKKARANYRTAEREIEKIPALKEADLEAAAAADIIVINYNKATINKDLAAHSIATGVDFLTKHFKIDFVALDEALIKSHETARTKDLLKLASVVPYRVIMSGTLINNTALDAFAPIRFLQPALTGMAYGKFDHHYGIKIKPRGKSFSVTIGVSKANMQEIREILESCSIVMRKEDWLDLPAKHFHQVRFELSEGSNSIPSAAAWPLSIILSGHPAGLLFCHAGEALRCARLYQLRHRRAAFVLGSALDFR